MLSYLCKDIQRKEEIELASEPERKYEVKTSLTDIMNYDLDMISKILVGKIKKLIEGIYSQNPYIFADAVDKGLFEILKKQIGRQREILQNENVEFEFFSIELTDQQIETIKYISKITLKTEYTVNFTRRNLLTGAKNNVYYKISTDYIFEMEEKGWILKKIANQRYIEEKIS